MTLTSSRMLDIQKATIKQLNVSCISVERIRYLRGFVIGIQFACATDKVWLFSLFSRGVEYVRTPYHPRGGEPNVKPIVDMSY